MNAIQNQLDLENTYVAIFSYFFEILIESVTLIFTANSKCIKEMTEHRKGQYE